MEKGRARRLAGRGRDDPALLQPAFYAHFTARMPVGPRFALIGDAAHSTSPQLGQGANMGLLDALALSEAIERHASLEAALPAYAAARRRNVRFYQAASDWLTPLFQSDSLAAARLRDLGLPALARFGYFRRETIRTLAGLKTGLFSTDVSALVGRVGLAYSSICSAVPEAVCPWGGKMLSVKPAGMMMAAAALSASTAERAAAGSSAMERVTRSARLSDWKVSTRALPSRA